jgi:TonB-dependent SusC/RagA subfamily outer membrane receptor
MGNGAIIIRGMSSINSRGLPLVLIDGMSMEWPAQINSVYDSPVEMVSVHDVESIDVFKGPRAAIFGMRGAFGVISITTRRGSGYSDSNITGLNYASFTPLGFQQPVEFYAPRYDNPESRYLGNPDYRTTIFWKPDIVVTESGKTSFEFYTSDFPTTYSVVIEGLTIDGKIVRQVEKITVK